MRVISVIGRGPHTVYTVSDGHREWTVRGKDNLPEDVFKEWRNRQARECMQKSRAGSMARPKEQDPTTANDDHRDPRQPLTDKKSSQEAETSEASLEKPKDVNQRAANLVTCKLCHEAEVKRIVIPCGHVVFCADCLRKALTQSKMCPICRSPIKDFFAVIMIE